MAKSNTAMFDNSYSELETGTYKNEKDDEKQNLLNSDIINKSYNSANNNNNKELDNNNNNNNEEVEVDQIYLGTLYGVVNGIMVVPVSVAFCNIIFRNDAFSKFLPNLTKLVLFSSAIHQIAFSQFSTLPFAVGQVQDAGLIFLSGIFNNIFYQYFLLYIYFYSF
jgi:hypothetical protein